MVDSKAVETQESLDEAMQHISSIKMRWSKQRDHSRDGFTSNG